MVAYWRICGVLGELLYDATPEFIPKHKNVRVILALASAQFELVAPSSKQSASNRPDRFGGLVPDRQTHQTLYGHSTIKCEE